MELLEAQDKAEANANINKMYSDCQYHQERTSSPLPVWTDHEEIYISLAKVVMLETQYPNFHLWCLTNTFNAPSACCPPSLGHYSAQQTKVPTPSQK
jgi:hypothetical protein